MKEFQHEGRRVESEIRVNAPAERVWRAWAEAEEIQRWFTDGATGRPVPGEVMTWSFDNFAQGIPYTVVEAMPGEKFSIGFEGPDGRRGLLEITLRQEGGETVVRLVNSGFRDGAAWDEEYEGVRSGWVCALAVLKLYLEMYAGKNKTTLSRWNRPNSNTPICAPGTPIPQASSNGPASRPRLCGCSRTRAARWFTNGRTRSERWNARRFRPVRGACCACASSPGPPAATKECCARPRKC